MSKTIKNQIEEIRRITTWWLLSDHLHLKYHLDNAANTIEQLLGYIEQIADGTTCYYDHHDQCQSHALHSKPCPYGEINELLRNERKTND